MLARGLLALLLTPYVGWLIFAYDYHFLDGVNLALHEGGHLIFAAFGQTLQVLGGTIGQLFFPIACAASFAHRKQIFEAAVCGVWAAESLMYTARYLGDARAQALPLVGGHLHDWNYLLSEAGLLQQSEALGTVLHVLASLAAVASLLVAMAHVKPSKV
jgi:hypothetical protein